MKKKTNKKGHILVAETRWKQKNRWMGDGKKCSSRTVATEQKTSKESGHGCETK